MSKWVYTFGDGKAEGDASMRNLLGGKGANLAEMNVVGLPVPPGFTVTTEVCTYYYNNNHTYPADLKDQVRAAVADVEKSWAKICRCQQPIAVLGSFRCSRFYAGYDGYRFEPRFE